MSVKSSSEDKEYARLLRQGAGNYVNLCGVLAGFVAVIMVLVLTPGFSPNTDTDVLFQLILILFSVSSFGFIITALGFVNISSTPLRYYKSLGDMAKEYAFNQYLVILNTAGFLGGATALNFYAGTYYVGLAVAFGFLAILYYLIRDWWALLRRTPPKKTG